MQETKTEGKCTHERSVELANTKGMGCRQDRACQRLFGITKHGLGTAP